MVGVAVPVGQDQDASAVLDRGRTLLAHPLQRRGESRSLAVNAVSAVDQSTFEAGQIAVGVDMPDLGQVVVVDNRLRQHDLTTGRGRGLEQVLLRPDRPRQRGDQFFPDRVQRRVGDLREQLGEVVEQHPRSLRQDRRRRVGTHRTERLGARGGHRLEDDP